MAIISASRQGIPTHRPVQPSVCGSYIRRPWDPRTHPRMLRGQNSPRHPLQIDHHTTRQPPPRGLTVGGPMDNTIKELQDPFIELFAGGVSVRRTSNGLSQAGCVTHINQVGSGASLSGQHEPAQILGRSRKHVRSRNRDAALGAAQSSVDHRSVTDASPSGNRSARYWRDASRPL